MYGLIPNDGGVYIAAAGGASGAFRTGVLVGFLMSSFSLSSFTRLRYMIFLKAFEKKENIFCNWLERANKKKNYGTKMHP